MSQKSSYTGFFVAQRILFGWSKRVTYCAGAWFDHYFDIFCNRHQPLFLYVWNLNHFEGSYGFGCWRGWKLWAHVRVSPQIPSTFTLRTLPIWPREPRRLMSSWGNACRCRLVFVWEEKFKSPAWVSMQIVSCGLVWRDNEGASIWVLPDSRWINFNNSFHVALATIACERCTFFLDLPIPILLLIRPYGDRHFHQSTNVTLVSRAKLGLNALTPKSSHVQIGFIVCSWIHSIINIINNCYFKTLNIKS